MTALCGQQAATVKKNPTLRESTKLEIFCKLFKLEFEKLKLERKAPSFTHQLGQVSRTRYPHPALLDHKMHLLGFKTHLTDETANGRNRLRERVLGAIFRLSNDFSRKILATQSRTKTPSPACGRRRPRPLGARLGSRGSGMRVAREKFLYI